MKTIWLAALLGVLVGLGLASTHNYPGLSPPTASQPLIQADQRNLEAVAVSEGPQKWQPAMVAMVVGLVAGVPFFILARRRNR